MGQPLPHFPHIMTDLGVTSNLALNGVVEFLEARMLVEPDDNSIPPRKYIEQYIDAISASTKLARLEDILLKLEKYARDAGFVDVKVFVKKIPIGT